MFGIGPMELLVIVVILLIFIVPTLFYIRTLYKALTICSEQNRAMNPNLVWLLFIPIFDIFFHFYVVLSISKSLKKEFEIRNIEVDSMPGQTIGLMMCASPVLAYIPKIGFIFAIGCFILWILYWVKIAGFSSQLSQ